MPPPAWVRRALDAYLGTDPHQRIRMTMTSLATAAMLPCVALFNALAWAGLAPPDLIAWWSLASLGGMLGVTACIRGGWALRLRDPSLTQFQLRYALVCTAWLYVVAGQARVLTPAILAVIMTFGIFGMSGPQTARTSAFGALLFGGAWWLARTVGPPGHSLLLEAGCGVVIAVVLLGTTVLSLRLQRMRARLSQQKAALAEALAQIRHLAAHDELTGLVNRRRMGEILAYELRRLRRRERPLHLAVLDIDRFKTVNDTHGHAHGDQVLQAFAAVVQACVRGSDVLARWGGEEFLLLLCDTDTDRAHEVVERVRRAVEEMPPLAPGTGTVTISIGLATHAAGEAIEQTLERADRALYEAKAGGRNRVVFAA